MHDRQMNTIESRYRNFVKDFDIEFESYIKYFDDNPKFQDILKRLSYPLTLLEWIEERELPRAVKEENQDYCNELRHRIEVERMVKYGSKT